MLILFYENKIIECGNSKVLLSVIEIFIMVRTYYPCIAF